MWRALFVAGWRERWLLFIAMRQKQPTPFNIVGWQVLAVDQSQVTAAITAPFPGCEIRTIARRPRMAAPPETKDLPPSVDRLAWFTDGFYQYRVAGDKLVMSDLRIGFSPSFVFSFEVARRVGGEFKGVTPIRFPLDTPRSEGVKQLFGHVAETLKTCG